ncbi:MAG: hypothetical protein H7329_00410, partial [Opitutaceae bacterium]|nr:hypothetical protein [Cytophagales bacterium]
MSEETNIWPLIDRYLSNSMDESEKADFEIKIASDPALADMVESYNLTELVVVSNESQKLKSIMTKDLSGQRIGWKTLLLSGILVAGIGFGIYFINPSVEKETVSVEKKAIVLEKLSIEKELPPDTVKTKIIEVPKNSKTSSKVEIKKEENPVAI